MPKIMSEETAAKKLSAFLLGNRSGAYWEKELMDALRAFAVKYHELSPEVAGTATNNHPSTLWHEFFVKSLQNMLSELPPNVDKLKEAVDELKRKEVSRKRRRTDDDDGDNIRTLDAKKRVKVGGVTKFRVHTHGCLYTLSTSKSRDNGEFLEIALANPSMIDAKMAPGSFATVHDNDKDDF